MVATLTDRTYAVAWDDADELGDRGIEGGPLRARLQVDPTSGRLLRWNGFVCPHFERSEIERYIAFVEAIATEGAEYGVVEFRGDELIMLPDEQYPDGEETVGPTELGLYPLGAFGWTWGVVPPDLDPDDAEPTFDEVEQLGLDGTGRDGDPRFPYTLANLTADETRRLASFRWYRCPDCGRDLASLGGNPDCRTCAAEPGRYGELPVAVRELADEYAYCDECHHSGRLHVNAHDLPEPARAFVFANATCWAENICPSCSPERARQLAELTAAVR